MPAIQLQRTCFCECRYLVWSSWCGWPLHLIVAYKVRLRAHLLPPPPQKKSPACKLMGMIRQSGFGLTVVLISPVGILLWFHLNGLSVSKAVFSHMIKVELRIWSSTCMFVCRYLSSFVSLLNSWFVCWDNFKGSLLLSASLQYPFLTLPWHSSKGDFLLS